MSGEFPVAIFLSLLVVGSIIGGSIGGVGLGASSTGPITASMAETNATPVTNDDTASVTPGDSVLIDVLANDGAGNATVDPSTVRIGDEPKYGMVSVNETTGVVNYTRTNSSLANDTFTYTVRSIDGSISNVTTVSITVSSTVEPPTARDDAITITPKSRERIDVLANDLPGADGIDPGSVRIVDQPENGTVEVHEDTGEITYIHALNQNGTVLPGRSPDTFTYTVRSKNGSVSNEATVSIQLTSNGESPTARNDTVSIAPKSRVKIDVLANDLPGENGIDPSSIRIVKQPKSGTVFVHEDTGEITYIHGLAENGTFFPGQSRDRFVYVVKSRPTGDTGGQSTDLEGQSTDGTSNQATVTVEADLTASDTTFEDSVVGKDAQFKNETVFTGLNQPTKFTFLPDGRMLFLQKGGRIFIANPETGQKEEYMDISSSVATDGERGLLGIDLDPEFGSGNPYFYVYYTRTESSGSRNRISRFTHEENSGELSSRGNASSEMVLWENPSPTKNCCHFGGGFGIGPNGRIYLTTGEEFDGAQAQNLSKADGKIIRINRDGTIPAGNPFVDDPDALDEIYAYGLRNPFSARWDLRTDRFFIAEVGGNDDDTAYEDINLGQSGANYGWPDCEGFCDNPDYTDPLYSYAHNGSGASVTAGPLYRGNGFPMRL